MRNSTNSSTSIVRDAALVVDLPPRSTAMPLAKCTGRHGTGAVSRYAQSIWEHMGREEGRDSAARPAPPLGRGLGRDQRGLSEEPGPAFRRRHRCRVQAPLLAHRNLAPTSKLIRSRHQETINRRTPWKSSPFPPDRRPGSLTLGDRDGRRTGVGRSPPAPRRRRPQLRRHLLPQRHPIRFPLPAGMGVEAAGVVEAVGPGSPMSPSATR